MARSWSVDDDWTPTLNKIEGKFSANGRKKRFKNLGYKMVARAKRMMSRSLGFGNQRQYESLKIKWRYRGRKTLAANKTNLRFAAKNPRSAHVVRSGGEATGVSKVSKKKVTGATRPLIDRGGFRRSWNVLLLKVGQVIFGPDSEFYRNLASIHGDPDGARSIMPERGNWDWGRKSIAEAEKHYYKDFDKGIFD